MARDANGRWYPEGATCLEAPEVNAMAYLYGLSAVAYHGKATRPDWHFTFRSEESRLAHLNMWRANLRAHADRVAQEAANRRAFRHALQIGDVLHYSWGYDQTQCEFFEVVARTEKTVTLRPVAGNRCGPEGFMSTHVVPMRGRYTGPAGRPQVVRPGNYVSMKYGSASPWSGAPAYESWYA